MVFPVIEMFCSIQGEGRFSGVPSFFVRVSGCNLRCVFRNSKCDTAYSSFEPEKSMFEDFEDFTDKFSEMVKQYPNVKHIVITGGEPMLYQAGIAKFIKYVQENLSDFEFDFTYTIETNGTIVVNVELEELLDTCNVMLSVSPKLSTSEDKEMKFLSESQLKHHRKTRTNYDALAQYALISMTPQFKFVYSGPECIDEINELLMLTYIEYQKRNDTAVESYNEFLDTIDIYLMPEGVNNEQLNKVRIECADVCVKKGWNYTDRLHVVIWGDKRGV